MSICVTTTAASRGRWRTSADDTTQRTGPFDLAHRRQPRLRDGEAAGKSCHPDPCRRRSALDGRSPLSRRAPPESAGRPADGPRPSHTPAVAASTIVVRQPEQPRRHYFLGHVRRAPQRTWKISCDERMLASPIVHFGLDPSGLTVATRHLLREASPRKGVQQQLHFNQGFLSFTLRRGSQLEPQPFTEGDEHLVPSDGDCDRRLASRATRRVELEAHCAPQFTWGPFLHPQAGNFAS